MLECSPNNCSILSLDTSYMKGLVHMVVFVSFLHLHVVAFLFELFVKAGCSFHRYLACSKNT